MANSGTTDEERRETIAKRLKQAQDIVSECQLLARILDMECKMAIAKCYQELEIAIREVRP